MSRTIKEILSLIDKKKSDFHMDENDFRVLIGNPDVIEHSDFSNIVEVMNDFLHNTEEFQSETYEKILDNPVWLDISELQEYLGWRIEPYFWRFRNFAEFQEEYSKNPRISKFIPLALRGAEAEYFTTFHLCSLFQHTPELVSDPEIEKAALTRVENIAEVFKKGEHFDHEGLWEAVLAIAKIPYLINHSSIKEALLGLNDFFAGYVFGADVGPFQGEVAAPNASAMLVVPYLTTDPLLQIALAYRIKEMKFTQEALDLPEFVEQLPLMYTCPLICLHFKKIGINLEGKNCPEVTQSDIEAYADALMKTKWPGVVAHGLFEFPGIYETDVIQKAIEHRCEDIAIKIETASSWYDAPMVWWFHDIPEILSHPRVKNAIRSNIDLLMNQFNTRTEEEHNHYRDILLGNISQPKRGTITVRYYDEGGKETATYIHQDEVHVECSNEGITNIKLDQFSSFPKMQKLSLNGNPIDELDLSAFVDFHNLEELDVDGMTNLVIDPMFKFVDWSPALVNLRNRISWQDYRITSRPKYTGTDYYLGWIHIETKFMTALSRMNKMKYMLQMGMLFGLGLSHLAAFDGELLELAVDRSKRSHPVMLMSRMQDDIESIIENIENGIDVYNKENSKSPYNIQGFIDGMKELSPSVRMRAQIAFIGGLGLPQLAGYDGNLVEVLESLSLPEDATMSKVTTRIQEVLIEKLKDQVAHKGPSLFMDMEKMVLTKAAPVAAFASQRKQSEIEETVLYEDANIDLRPLWVTGWGYEILKALKCGLNIDRPRFERIRSAFERANLTLKMTKNKKDARTGVVISEEMKQAVYWMALDPLDRVR